MFSCFPFWWGLAGSMRSGMIPSWTNQTESLERRPEGIGGEGAYRCLCGSARVARTVR